MPDYPPAPPSCPQKTVVNVFGPNGMVGDPQFGQNLALAAAAWPAANRAIYVAFWIEQPMVAKKLFCRIGTTSGNLDMGLYNAFGTRIVSKGSTAVGSANSTQLVDITTSVTGTASPTLLPGWYFVALCASNTTATFWSGTLAAAEICRVSGVEQEALGSVALGATATFANPASAYVPMVGVGSTQLWATFPQ